MATTGDAVKAVLQAGTKISKEKVLEALRKLTAKEIEFAKDSATGYSLILVKIG